MKTKALAASAAKINASARSGGALAFASGDRDLVSASDSLQQIKAFPMKALACNHCGTNLTASADSTPFCVNCGSDDVHPVDTVEPDLDQHTEDNVAAINCSGCKTYNVISSSVIKASGGHIHCSACGTKLKAEYEEPAPETKLQSGDEVGEPTMKTPDPDPTQKETNPVLFPEHTKADTAYDSGEMPSDDALDEGDSEMLVSDEDLSDVEADPLLLEDDGNLEALGPMDVSPNDTPEVTENGLPEFLADEIPQESAEELNEDPVITEDTFSDFGELPSDDVFVEIDTSEGDPLMDSLAVDDSPAGFTAAVIANRLVAFKGHVAIASLSSAEAGNRPFKTENFAKAVCAFASEHGVRSAIKAFKFKPICVKSLTQASVDKKLTDIKASASKAATAKVEKFNSSLALAAAGLSRGNWKGYTNPLRAAFEAELSRAGVRNPQRAAAQIFQAHAVSYTKTLAEVAANLSKYSDSARAELASMLDMTEEPTEEIIQVPEATDSGLDPEEGFPQQLESRLTTAALLRPKATPLKGGVKLTASAEANAILYGDAKLSF